MVEPVDRGDTPTAPPARPPEPDEKAHFVDVAKVLRLDERVAEVVAAQAERRAGQPLSSAAPLFSNAVVETKAVVAANHEPLFRLVDGRDTADPDEQTVESTTLAHTSEAPATNSTATTSGGASHSAALLALAESSAEVFCDDTAEPLAAIELKGRREILRIRSREFRGWLHHLFYARYRTVPGGTALKDVLAVLEGNARFGSATHQVHVRVARVGDCIYLDLANEHGEVVRISRDGWEVVRAPRVHFRRTKGMAALPRPVRGGTVDELRPFVNMATDDAFHLFVSWEVCTLRPEGPYPVVLFQGEHGSAKSSATRISRALVDASKIPVRSMPKSERDLAVAVSSAWVLAIDNQSGLKASVSDALCRVSTGGGVGSRQLYSDGDEFVMGFMRPVVVNGIDDLATRPDLAERALVFNLPPIAAERRVDEATLMERFREAHPRILGALLDGVVSALASIDAVQLDAPPRMADFARWATAAEAGLGWKQGTFIAAYSRHRRETDQETLERDVVGALIPRLAGTSWSGTASQLQRELNALADEDTKRDPAWPRQPNAMSARLRRIAPLLRTAGYEVTARRGAGERTLTIARTPSSPSSPSSFPPPDGADGDDDHDGHDDRRGSIGADDGGEP